MYTLSSYPVSSLEIHKRVIFCHSNLPQPIDISLLETWSWKCESHPFSSHLNEPWGMRITQYSGCTLSATCTADPASASLPKGVVHPHAFTFDQRKSDSLLLPGLVFHVNTGIKFPTQSELAAHTRLSHLGLLPSSSMHFHMTTNITNMFWDPPLVQKVR